MKRIMLIAAVMAMIFVWAIPLIRADTVERKNVGSAVIVINSDVVETLPAIIAENGESRSEIAKNSDASAEYRNYVFEGRTFTSGFV